MSRRRAMQSHVMNTIQSPGAAPSNLSTDPGAEFVRPHDYLRMPEGMIAQWKFGHGPDVVFVHGWPLHAATFRALAPLLAARFTCHLFDLPGSGQTQSPAG